MDITPDFSKLLQAKGCSIVKQTFDLEAVEGFVKEAYRIVGAGHPHARNSD